MSESDSWRWFESRRVALFVLAGASLVVFTVVTVAQALTSPDSYAEAREFFRSVGFLFGLLGLLGLYRSLARRRSRIGGAGVLFVVLGVLGLSISAVWSLAQFAGLATTTLVPTVVLLVLELLGVVLGYLAFVVATLRSDVYPRTLGLLLLVPVLVFAAGAVLPEVLGSFRAVRLQPVLALFLALTHLAVGSLLRAGPAADVRA